MKVRCWKVHKADAVNGVVFATYPSGNSGHTLHSCSLCGHVYAVDLSVQVYLGPSIEEIIRNKQCSRCAASLSGSLHRYPETFVGHDGEKKEWERPFEIPHAEDSLILDFEDLYEGVERL